MPVNNLEPAMPIIDEAKIRAMMPNAGTRLDRHIPFIEPARVWGNITSPARIAPSWRNSRTRAAKYRFMEELADGSDYEGATILQHRSGDGVKFKGTARSRSPGAATTSAAVPRSAWT
jgi:hypothetical protein